MPAFNEAANLERAATDTIAALSATPWISSFELIVVDDGSRDGTREVAEKLARQDARVQVVSHPANRGFGAALRTGYARATCEFVSVVPADGEIGADQVVGLLALADDAALVVSSREPARPVHREFFTACWHLMMRTVLGFDLKGVEGIYVIRTDLLRTLTLRSSTGLISLEVIMQCVRLKVPMRRGTMRVSPRLSGESKVLNVRTMTKTAWEILKLRFAR